MELSILLGKFFGIYLLIIGIFCIVKRKFLVSILNEVIRSPALFAYSGFFGVIGGLFIVLGHNVWNDWSVVITIIGYLILINGLVRLFYPHHLEVLSRRILTGKGPEIIAIISILVGAFLVIKSFFII